MSILAFTVSDFPALNATLNGMSALCLIAGLILIKQGKQKAHRNAMIAALIFSTLFLGCYLTYHALKQGVVTTFPTEYPVARMVYLSILIPHTTLAVINLPMIITTVIFAAKGNFVRHRKWARWTFPIWLFVCVTGVIVYLMLYQWYPPTV